MFKLFALSATLLAGLSSAQAETFNCTFTEPFASVKYVTESGRMSVVTPEHRSPRVMNHVSFQIVSRGTFLLKSSGGKEVLRLHLTGKGSDGMSDTIYPFEAMYAPHKSGASGGRGGCSSSLLKAKQP